MAQFCLVCSSILLYMVFSVFYLHLFFIAVWAIDSPRSVRFTCPFEMVDSFLKFRGFKVFVAFSTYPVSFILFIGFGGYSDRG